jgi:hypothetical protein
MGTFIEGRLKEYKRFVIQALHPNQQGHRGQLEKAR